MIPDTAGQESLRASAQAFVSESARQRISNAHFRIGLPQWEDGVVGAAMDVYDLTVKAYGASFNDTVNTLRDVFEIEAREAFAKVPSKTRRESVDQWVANAGFNAAVEAVARSKGKSMDLDACMSHTDVEFSASEGYPGRPGTRGWLRCACKLTVGTGALVAAGNASDPGVAEGEEPKAAVVVLLPRATEPVVAMASGEHPHVTLFYLGDGTVDLAPLLASVQLIAEQTATLMTDKVNGRAVLGKDKADVLLLDATGSSLVRNVLAEDPEVVVLQAMQEQFPTWIPHLTVGYPEDPANGDELPEDVTYDRLAVWRGNEVWEFTLEDSPKVEEKVIHPEDPEFSQEMADALVAATPPPSHKDDDDTDYDLEYEETKAVEEGFDPNVPWHGIIVVEGIPTGDNRMFSVGALTHRTLPVPLKWMPKDAQGHDDSVVVGRIDKMWRVENKIYAEGVFDDSENAYEALRQVANQMLRGVSIDVDSAVESANEEVQELAEGRVSAATLCAIPAFAEAFIALGSWEDGQRDAIVAGGHPVLQFDVAPAKTKDGPGWKTEPEPTQQITGYWVDGRGAAKIGWGAPGDFNRCRTQLGKYVQNPQWLAGLCANLHYRALGVWPGQQSAALENAEMYNELGSTNLVASVTFAEETPVRADFFRNPGLEGPTPMTVTDEGHVYGHVATWGTCHIGYPGECVTAPESATQYAYFHTGVVHTDAGPVPVGQVSLGGGHASLKYGVRATIAHYDQTSMAVADVTAGEDEHGIWVAGALREGVTAAQVRELRASPLSGDWREVVFNGRRSQEMVAALAVNVPGFPIPRSGVNSHGQHSLTAAGVVMPYTDKMETVNDARSMFRNMELDDLRGELNLIGD